MVALAGLLMAVGCVAVAVDAPGRILTGVATVGLLVFALGSWRARPRLAITGAGPDAALLYRGWLHSQLLRRADIDLIRITEFRRLGRKVRLLEIDTYRMLALLALPIASDAASGAAIVTDTIAAYAAVIKARTLLPVVLRLLLNLSKLL